MSSNRPKEYIIWNKFGIIRIMLSKSVLKDISRYLISISTTLRKIPVK